MTMISSPPSLRSRWHGMSNAAAVRQAGIFLAYGCAFTALHHIAAQWAAGALFSLWFPAAGLRFAFLSRVGARKAPAAALAELVVQLATGEATLGAAPLLGIVGIVSPCLVYGLVIHVVRAHGGRRTSIIAMRHCRSRLPR